MMSEKDFERHKCGEPPLKECRTIEVVEIYDGSYDGNKLLNGMGVDGVLYTFELVSRKALPVVECLNRRKVTGRDEFSGTDEEVPVPPVGIFKIVTSPLLLYPI